MFACRQKHSHTQSQQLARVGSTYLTLEEAKNAIPDFSRQDSAYAIHHFRQQWIRRQLLLHEAKRLKLDQQKSVQRQMKRAQSEVLLDALKKNIISNDKSQFDVSDREAVNYYHQHQNKLTLQERYVRYRLIETKKLGDARMARQMLQNDSSWVEIAKKYSLKSKKNINRSHDFWPVSSLKKIIPSLQRDVASLDSGQFSPIRRVETGYQFLEVTGIRKQGETADARWFIKQLKTWRMHEKQHNYYKSYVKNLYLSAKKNNEITLYNVK